jgi:hypothetical protein
MIHDTLKSLGGITETKGNDQELIVTLMSEKYSLENFFLFHTYLVVARMEVKFGKVLSPTEFIQKVIYDMNGKFILDGKFVEAMRINTHAPSAFLLEDHDDRARIGDGTWITSTSRNSWTIFSISFF